MNYGKTHSFYSWASLHAWVPPNYFNTSIPPPNFSYSNHTTAPLQLATHDSPYAWQDRENARPKPWVRPDYVAKCDDDSFVMLAELESRLRLELHNHPKHYSNGTSPAFHAGSKADGSDNSPTVASRAPVPVSGSEASQDPLIYWGYLVTNRLHRFMAGELYALSWSLVDWVAKDPGVKGMTKGAEDKQTAKWMRAHPQASEVRWASERCWIYDHPRSGTVYVYSDVLYGPHEVLTPHHFFHQIRPWLPFPFGKNQSQAGHFIISHSGYSEHCGDNGWGRYLNPIGLVTFECIDLWHTICSSRP